MLVLVCFAAFLHSFLSLFFHFFSERFELCSSEHILEHFNSYDKAAELIDGGDISALWTNAGWSNETLPEVGPLYYSSRGEDYPPRLDATFGKYIGNNEEYAYLFANGKWVCYNNRRWDDKFLQQVEIPVPVAA